jgi:hypothetical protein
MVGFGGDFSNYARGDKLGCHVPLLQLFAFLRCGVPGLKAKTEKGKHSFIGDETGKITTFKVGRKNKEILFSSRRVRIEFRCPQSIRAVADPTC